MGAGCEQSQAAHRTFATMAQEDKRLTRINKTRFVVAANARFRVLMEQPFREDAVRLGVLPAPRLLAGGHCSRCRPLSCFAERAVAAALCRSSISIGSITCCRPVRRSPLPLQSSSCFSRCSRPQKNEHAGSDRIFRLSSVSRSLSSDTTQVG